MICVGVLRSYDALISAARGDIDRVRALQPDLHTPSRAIQGVVTLARAAGQRALGDVAAAKQLISTFLGSAGPLPPVEVALLLEELADLAVDDGDETHARELVEQIVPGEALSLTWVVALRARALAHRDPDAARQAVDGCRAIGMPFELARSQVILGALGVDPHDNLIAAHAVFSDLGALGWRKRAARAMRSAGITAPRMRATIDGDVLSGVDSELARLLGHGLTNAQIASALHYSRKTVEVYLSRIYRRTGCRSRLDLVRAIDGGRIALVD
jgi:DNA-binding CsgD family transcriptional regulator